MAGEMERLRQEELEIRQGQVARPDAKKIGVNEFKKTYSQQMIEFEQKKQAQLE